jgi:hypothetical protein
MSAGATATAGNPHGRNGSTGGLCLPPLHRQATFITLDAKHLRFTSRTWPPTTCPCRVHYCKTAGNGCGAGFAEQSEPRHSSLDAVLPSIQQVNLPLPATHLH